MLARLPDRATHVSVCDVLVHDRTGARSSTSTTTASSTQTSSSTASSAWRSRRLSTPPASRASLAAIASACSGSTPAPTTPLQGNLLQPWSVPDIRLGRSGARDLSVQYATDSLADPDAALATQSQYTEARAYPVPALSTIEPLGTVPDCFCRSTVEYSTPVISRYFAV